MEMDAAMLLARDQALQFDPKYEFSAPRYFDFSKGETAEEATAAERWFETASNYPVSPFVVKSKPFCEMSTSYNLEEYIEVQKRVARISSECHQDECLTASKSASPSTLTDLVTTEDSCTKENIVATSKLDLASSSILDKEQKPCTPTRETIVEDFVVIADGRKSASCSIPKKRLHSASQKQATNVLSTVATHTECAISRNTSSKGGKRGTTADHKVTFEEQQAKKRQKLEGGQPRQIWNTKNGLPQSRGLVALTIPQEFHFCTDKRAQIHKETGICSSISKVECPTSPFISLAEKIQRFQTKTPERFRMQSFSHDEFNFPKSTVLTLTRPIEPELETSQRARPPRVKSFVEEEEEMLASCPKFKARPLNKKILEAPTLPRLPRSTPQLPEFQEFNLRTMERALMHRDASTSSNLQFGVIPNARESKVATSKHFSAQGEPHLETAARFRPPKVKSSDEIEQEELAKIPKFKARPLNKRIFSSRGDVGIYCNTKRQATRPQEFRFATDERALRHSQTPLSTEQIGMMLDSFRLQPSNRDFTPQQLTVPQPFHLATEDRGVLKERQFQLQLFENEKNDKNSRIPKANLLPYTTDFPSVPPKPQPRETTKAEPFHLESLLRHEQDQLRFMRECAQAEKDLSEKRAFRAQPFSCKNPASVPERTRRPLTEVQPFVFQADAQAMKRAEFDRKFLQRRREYEQQKEEYEAAKKAHEENTLKALRKETMFRANPMPMYSSPFVPLRSTMELTQPITPKLQTSILNGQRQSHGFVRQMCFMR